MEESAESNWKGLNRTDFELLSKLLDWMGSLDQLQAFTLQKEAEKAPAMLQLKGQ